MRREELRDLEAERLRRLRDRDRDDFGQADYSNTYGYDPRTRSGYAAYDDGRPAMPDAGRGRARADWDPEPRRARRDGPSDRVLWAVIMERLDAERRLDLRDVQVEVVDGEAILNGVVRHKADKRRIEDIADIDGIHNVQNNLKPRERGRGWTFL
ncbi:MAG: BON domain-containing protein [Alphaproteobacteria bacterium]|nr:BON domain-containing protein [Alphaproteobacteria bacterium]MBU1513563.1 BON domain-containing protein [Alphaproteobacteria bacterium]MBU2094792.1 BON domain-containing protein [Alphaproteobacteria bacterium]MBU2150139.1 BON domain-containing protein [Alphaproteobacteria bacterium]MBU2309332.1 BON domain-containing protein [Alphaproteobacteria bacterium]